ncbi:MAG: PolC-type DNA polymerase III [Ruminococcaceae bacterium]|nr:PolC-type DNA polymerase III [Oscillospiraceae bacterium]
MPNSSFINIFGDYLSSELKSALPSGEVGECSLSLEERSLRLSVAFEDYIPYRTILETESSIKRVLSLESLDFKYSFPKECLNLDALVDLSSVIKSKNAAYNGYFNGAEYSYEGIFFNIVLKFGGLSAVKGLHFDVELKKLVKELFAVDIEVVISGEEALSAPETPEAPISAPPRPEKPAQKPAAPVESKPKKVFSGKPADGLPVYLESAELFYGRALDRKVKPLSEYIPLGSPDAQAKFCGWGRVFEVDSRTVNTKRGPMVSCKFCFSDNTNSLEASLFIDAKRKEEIKPLSNGAVLLVNGTYEYDRWMDSFIVKVSALATLEEYFPKDEAEHKRIELHCHTNMSAKDAVSSAGDIIKHAAKLGHSAIAITDHGVVQAYPAAAAAVKKLRKAGKDFKVIYGVEGYLVDDEKYDLSKMNSKEIGKLRRHIIMLVKDFTGLKNLYKLVSEAHLNDFHGRPCTLRSKLKAHREGLIVGSACEAGEFYTAIIDGKTDEELCEIARFYDYLEIQPVGNNEFMIRASAEPDHVDKRSGAVTPNRFRRVTSFDVIRDFNRKVVEIADKVGLPVVATGDVHFLKKEDEVIRKILLAGQGFDDFDHQAPLWLHTTAEMLEEFSYFGDRAEEFVVTNPAKINEMISGDIIPVPDGNYPPVIEGSDDELRDICRKRARAMYGDPLPPYVEERLEKELNGIINNGYSIMYMSAQRLVKYSEDNGYLVGSRGSVGSSFVATMAGISEVNPLAPHYYCPECQYNEFFLKGEVGSGFDLPEKNCPKCGAPLLRDGHDIPFETFLGFKGDKVPDIDLNFSDEFQSEVQKYTEQLFGRENVFKAGTISTIAEKTAFGFAKAYAEKKNIVLNNAELKRLAGLLRDSEVKSTTGQHPAGMIVVPRDKEIYDFCPIQHPADDTESDIITTHFDFHSIHDTILKLDELGHVVPTTYKYLEEFSGIPVNAVSMSDPAVYSLFTSTEALGVTPEEIFSQNGTFCIPEFGTDFVRGMLLDCRPKNFADLLQISGLSHGTDVYLGNAKDLIDKGICTISEVIGTRDNIMVYLIHQGIESGLAFKITETVRKGLIAKGAVSMDEWNSMTDVMREHGVPEWYIESCGKIKYMFPKAHAAAYVISALRLAWYKVHKPIEFYCAFFTARPEDIEVETVMRGKEAVRQRIASIKAKGKEASVKETDVHNKLLIINEMLSRGLEILPIDLKKSHATRYELEDGKMRLPFCALSGVGDKAAEAIYAAAQEGDYISKDEFQTAAGVSKTIIQTLSDIGALGDLPDSNQMSFF